MGGMTAHRIVYLERQIRAVYAKIIDELNFVVSAILGK